jgi:fatty acid CoA ligase FadD9
MAFVGRTDVKDPGAQQDQWERLTRRRERLYVEDEQFRITRPDEQIAAAARAPGLRIAEVMATVFAGYADRPALGQRVSDIVTDPGTGRSSLRFLPRFETVSYADLWARVQSLAADWHSHETHPVRTGDFVCVLGFASIDYTAIECACIHLGAVVVPLQTSAPASQHAPILTETQPRIFAVGIDNLETALEAVLAASLTGTAPQRLIVFDYEPRDDDQRASYEAARARLAGAGSALSIEIIDDVVAQGKSLAPPPLHVASADEDPLAWVFYTSGSTGTPKGAMFTESLCIGTWLAQSDQPVITLSYMPMSHLIGYGYVILTLANGGTSYFAAKSDLSTLFDDLALVRPTSLSLVPRVCEMFYHHYQRQLDRHGRPDEAADDLITAIREQILGGRVLAVGCGSAALSPEIKVFMEAVLDQHLLIGYSSTEIAGGMIVADEHVLRPPVIDYKLLDVPELGYFNTDKPYSRGELAVKSARFMAGYYNRPDLTATMFDEDGYYKTGDIMAEVGPDQLRYVDRRNNVIKLSQGEFVAVSRLEALYSTSALIHQIYIYGTSERSFLLAVVVPTEDGVNPSRIADSLRQIARESQLNGYEIPRDFLIETEPFSLANGLLSGVGKFLRPKLKARYGDQLEQLYLTMADQQLGQLRALRTGGPDQPVLATVTKAVQATLGVPAGDVSPEARFSDLGGDSLSALTFSTLLADIYGVEVPVGVVVDPTGDLLAIADHIERHRLSDKPNYASVHGTDSVEVRAADLTLDKFIDDDVLKTAMTLSVPTRAVRTVLLTGATGFLGRFLGLEWLQKLADAGGTLVCLTRGADATAARQRIEAALDSDAGLLDRFRTLADGHLEVIAGDIGERNFGLDDTTWERLAQTVDLIVHPAAHVNHVLPYRQLFTPNVAGTAEVIRLAITARLKPIHYISTMGVSAVAHQLVDEDTDIRRSVPACVVNDSYANGYGISKWAGEVLMREAHDVCGLPVAVFRPGMILADTRYVGQLNVPDIFTRLLFSLAATGVAPDSFYFHGDDSPRPHYEGLPVDFLAEAIAAIGIQHGSSFDTYNTTNPHDDGISLDTFVDWIIAAGYPIEKIHDYSGWLARFETSMRALPERQRAQSVLTVLDVYREPMPAVAGSPVPGAQFQSAVEHSGRAIPHVTQQLIGKYLAELGRLGVLTK